MYAFFVFVLSYVGRSLVTGWYPVQGVLPDIYKQDSKTWKLGDLGQHWPVMPYKNKKKAAAWRISKWIFWDVNWIEL
jgi:hypothetical protein